MKEDKSRSPSERTDAGFASHFAGLLLFFRPVTFGFLAHCGTQLARPCDGTSELRAKANIYGELRSPLHDHAGGDGFVGAGVDEDEGAGVAVAAVGIVDEGGGGAHGDAADLVHGKGIEVFDFA